MKVKWIIKYIILTVLLFPLLMMIGWSVSSAWPWPSLIPQGFTLRAYSYVLEPTTGVFKILVDSMILSIVVTAITLLVSIPAARAIAFYDFKGKSVVKVLILLPLIVPMLTVAMGIHLRFIRLGLANTFWGVVLIHVIPGIPYGVKILLNVFELNGNKIETQARILGASPLQVIRYVTLPLITPGLIIAGSIIYIASFSQYFITFLIGGGRIVTYAMFLFPFVESGDRTMASALSIVFILSITLVLFITEKIVGNFYEKSSRYYV
ncbi:ABC transporter permease [Alkaliphilus hydrothermalis]|uniref:Spermidine/putrescine transport system permease protein n=1 Tax=Alkaliphilus hydrothermalis TaxID=1482730 RepID=A0ABS2NQG8_9FIRM|nr:ABC transporter permease subunit [Alkaliphilus hydrothermalis]MBM7615181.1 putative spermidine/putrescine transport system permease protein [Alkaliphilus hydrothermalis]